MSAVVCLQHFLNSVTRQASHAGLDLSNLLFAPAGLGHMICPWPEHETLHPVQYSVKNCMFNFGVVIGADALSLHESFRASWQEEHAAPYTTQGLTLSSSSVDWATLGDFVAFAMLHLQDFQGGVWVGLSLLFIRQLGKWLDQNWVHLLRFQPMIDIPDLRGFARACRKDLRDQTRLDFHNNTLHGDRVWCMAYFMKWATIMSHAKSCAFTAVSDGWRGSGEAMELFYFYNPDENLGAYHPFGVPLSFF